MLSPFLTTVVVAVAVLGCTMESTLAFTGISSSSSPSIRRPLSLTRPHQRVNSVQLYAAAPAIPIPNLFKRLPWNVRKEREREMRRMKQERAVLHRQLGIAEDATYEEIVIATDSLIAKAGGDIKKKVSVEVAKDKILQIRLNERLAGLQEVSKDARAQSRAELEGADDDEKPKQAAKEWNAPRWMQGLVVKPDRVHIISQARLWGIITMLGIAVPPAQDYLGRFTWLICIAQLTFRGMPKEQQDSGGMSMSFSGGGGSHRKVAFALGFSVWVFGAVLTYSLMPAWAKGQRWTSSAAFFMQNAIFATASCYLQPYKG